MEANALWKSTKGTLDEERKYVLNHSMNHSQHAMKADVEVVQLNMNLIRVLKAKKALEIGVYTGFNAMGVALAMPDDGVVVGLDISEEYADIGKPFWKQAGVDHKIRLKIGPALQSLDELLAGGEEKSFDFAFIDADKVNYLNYYERCLKLVRSGGIICFDNMFHLQAVFDKSNNSPGTSTIRKLNDSLYKDDRVYMSMLDISDGVTFCIVK